MITTKFLTSLIYWFLFGLIHSLMATTSFKSLFSTISDRQYRIIYNLINTGVLLGIVYLLPSPTNFTQELFDFNTRNIVSYLFIAAGMGMMTYGLSAWDLPEFFGIEGNSSQQLNTFGPYRISRHPVYTGAILFFIGLVLVQINDFTLSLLIGAGGYFIVGSFFEERKLIQLYGDEYLSYRKTVGRIIPHKKLHFQTLFGRDTY